MSVDNGYIQRRVRLAAADRAIKRLHQLIAAEDDRVRTQRRVGWAGFLVGSLIAIAGFAWYLLDR